MPYIVYRETVQSQSRADKNAKFYLLYHKHNLFKNNSASPYIALKFMEMFSLRQMPLAALIAMISQGNGVKRQDGVQGLLH